MKSESKADNIGNIELLHHTDHPSEVSSRIQEYL